MSSVSDPSRINAEAGVWPILKPAIINNFPDMANGNRLEGFNGDGDFVRLPISNYGSIAYYDPSGALVWNKAAPSALTADADNWCGFVMSGGLIYTVTYDTAINPHRYYLSTIDSAGTVVNIGNNVPATDFPNNPSWTSNSIVVGATSIQRESIDGGNILVMQTQAEPLMMEINIGTGAIVSDPESLGLTRTAMPYKVSEGKFLIYGDSGYVNVGTVIGGVVRNQANEVSQIIGRPLLDSVSRAIQWKGTVARVTPSASAATTASRFWDGAVFAQWVEDIIKLDGIA